MPGIGRRWSLARIGLGLITAGALMAGAPAAGASATAAHQGAARGGEGGRLVVPTADGALRGTTAGAMDEFLGIPYAAPPVGRLRWRPPHPARPWPGIRPATTFAPHCPQPASPFGVASTSENCLYLNVYRPAHSRGRRLPVLVWIHGGSLLVGESDDYSPVALVRHGIIVVSINYRLGALGFLADAALARRPGGPSGNYGLMDQQAALRWVQRNIGAFGGDRRDVTIDGESAGGLSVLSQLASPRARGLFARAIVESGTYN
ncbi:MAG: carboxylesterase family protein, partial [Streptosporangiaceae bacterium]